MTGIELASETYANVTSHSVVLGGRGKQRVGHGHLLGLHLLHGSLGFGVAGRHYGYMIRYTSILMVKWQGKDSSNDSLTNSLTFQKRPPSKKKDHHRNLTSDFAVSVAAFFLGKKDTPLRLKKAL